MDIGNKIHQLRKISGMTQEQLAEKLSVSRQTVSKWESGGTTPDLESMVKIGRMFQVSLDELLLKGEEDVTVKDEKITLEDLMEINLHNRKMTLLLTAGLIFIMVGVLTLAFVLAISAATYSTQYMLYRYIVTGKYAYAPISYTQALIPAIVAGMFGILLCVCYLMKNKDGKRG